MQIVLTCPGSFQARAEIETNQRRSDDKHPGQQHLAGVDLLEGSAGKSFRGSQSQLREIKQICSKILKSAQIAAEMPGESARL